MTLLKSVVVYALSNKRPLNVLEDGGYITLGDDGKIEIQGDNRRYVYNTSTGIWANPDARDIESVYYEIQEKGYPLFGFIEIDKNKKEKLKLVSVSEKKWESSYTGFRCTELQPKIKIAKLIVNFYTFFKNKDTSDFQAIPKALPGYSEIDDSKIPENYDKKERKMFKHMMRLTAAGMCNFLRELLENRGLIYQIEN